MATHILYSSGVQNSKINFIGTKIKLSPGPGSIWKLQGRICFLLFQLLELHRSHSLAHGPVFHLKASRVASYFSVHIAFSFWVKSPCFPLIEMLVIAFKAHMDDPG